MSAIVKNILLPTTTIGEYFTSTILLGIYPVTTLQRICNIKKEPFDKLCFFLVDAAGAPWRRGEAHWHSPLKTVNFPVDLFPVTLYYSIDECIVKCVIIYWPVLIYISLYPPVFIVGM